MSEADKSTDEAYRQSLTINGRSATDEQLRQLQACRAAPLPEILKSQEMEDPASVKEIDELLVATTREEAPPVRPGAHIMVDIETWGTGPAAIPISIGAVRFWPGDDILTNIHGDRFEVSIDPKSCAMRGLQIDIDTVLWWMDKKQRVALDHWLDQPRFDIVNALEAFSMWYGLDELPTWGKGPAFDNVIINTAYNAIGAKRPWHFRFDRDYRSIRGLLPDSWKPTYCPDGVHHGALSDAVWQMFQLVGVAQTLGLKLS